MKRTLRQLPLFAALLMALFLIGGCDDANTPDVPVQPYSLAATVPGPSVITDLDASGSYVAVAYEYFGYNVLDVSNVNAISIADTFRPHYTGARCDLVALDAANGFVYSFLPTDVGFESPVRDFRLHRRIYWINASSGTVECVLTGRTDSVTVWLTDNLGKTVLKCQRAVRQNDTLWRNDAGFPAVAWSAPLAGNRVQRFGVSATGAAAFAFDAGIAVVDAPGGACTDTLLLPGHAYDCAWHGNNIVVAAEYAMLIVNADNMSELRLVKEFVLPRADRLRQVEMDGNYAVLMDDADGIYVVDVSDVTAPKLVQELPFTEPAALDVENHTLFVGDRVQGLQIFRR